MENTLHEVAKIMGVDEDTVMIFPKIKFPNNSLNCWGDELPKVFQTLNLNQYKTVLDIPCGQGGVSVYLAKEYNLDVEGYDLLQGFIDNANEYASEHNVKERCHFFVDDIRNVTNKNKEYDLLLWIAPPHIWTNYEQTMENLRKCVKHNGLIVIADAYLYSAEGKDIQPDYETLGETLKSVTAHGDRIINFIDYEGSLWAENYKSDRQAVTNALNNSKDQTEKNAFAKYLQDIDESELSDIKCFGLYVLVMRVIK